MRAAASRADESRPRARAGVARASASADRGSDRRRSLGTLPSTSTMGADHTAGQTLGAPIEHTSSEMQAVVSKGAQESIAVCDNLMCLFGWIPLAQPEGLQVIAQALEGMYGGEWNQEKVMEIGLNTLRLERQFNRESGFNKKDDRLPDFFYEETTPGRGTKFDLSDDELDMINA